MRPTPDRIAIRAYELWCKRGCLHGNPEQDWYEAKAQLWAEYIQHQIDDEILMGLVDNWWSLERIPWER
jgi:hypothetical protein